MSHFCECSRCGERSFERLATYGHCINCFYSEDYQFYLDPKDICAVEEDEREEESDVSTQEAS